MKIIKEEYKNFPKNLTPTCTAVEEQALEDTKEFDRRKKNTEKEVMNNAKLPVDGAPKANANKEVPEKAIVPDMLTEALKEDINAENAARIVQETIQHEFGVYVDVVTYKDTDDSKCVIVEFIASKADCKKMPYDELKEELYKRFGSDINISCKQFSSPNLKNKGTEYKLKLFVLKEKKDKSKIYAESMAEAKTKTSPLVNSTWTEDDGEYIFSNGTNIYGTVSEANDKKADKFIAEIFDDNVNPEMSIRAKRTKTLEAAQNWIEENITSYCDIRNNLISKISLYTRVYNELNKQSDNGKELAMREFSYPNSKRYLDTWDDDSKKDIYFDVNDIIVYGPNEDYLKFAQMVADHYGMTSAKIEKNTGKYSSDPKKAYKIVFHFTDEQLPTDEEEDALNVNYRDTKKDEIED